MFQQIQNICKAKEGHLNDVNICLRRVTSDKMKILIQIPDSGRWHAKKQNMKTLQHT
jgi:hypothetical protein